MKTRVRHRRATVLCAGLASTVAVLGCAAQQRLPTDPRAASGEVTMPLYDETTYYNVVKNRWFGLGDYATDQPGR
jgi:outer membrane protein